jgi:hypothetical protein
MEFGIKKIIYEVYEGSTIVHKGEAPSFLLSTLTDIYCDFENSKYSIKVKINNKEFIVKSPDNFNIGIQRDG